MSEYHFGLHNGHLNSKLAGKIAERHGAWHINYTDPGTNKKRGWFCCNNLGNPHDSAVARDVTKDLDNEYPDWREK